jgi:hypothetical protein
MDNANERIERLLVLTLLQTMKSASQKEKASHLNIAGFSNIEIAEFLQTSSAVVASLIYQFIQSFLYRFLLIGGTLLLTKLFVIRQRVFNKIILRNFGTESQERTAFIISI